MALFENGGELNFFLVLSVNGGLLSLFNHVGKKLVGYVCLAVLCLYLYLCLLL